MTRAKRMETKFVYLDCYFATRNQKHVFLYTTKLLVIYDDFLQTINTSKLASHSTNHTPSLDMEERTTLLLES